jgi:hypothetical protein
MADRGRRTHASVGAIPFPKSFAPTRACAVRFLFEDIFTAETAESAETKHWKRKVCIFPLCALCGLCGLCGKKSPRENQPAPKTRGFLPRADICSQIPAICLRFIHRRRFSAVSAFDPYLARRVLWRIMLAALGLSALVAVLAVLVGGTQAGQWIMHIIVAAIATGLMAGASKMVDWPKARGAALFAMAAILIEFLLIAAAIWADVQQVAGLALAFFLSAFPSIAFFHLTQTRAGRRAGWAGLGLAGTIFLLFVAASFQNGSRAGGIELWEIAWQWWLACMCIVICLAGWGADHRFWRWIGVGAALVAFILGAKNEYVYPYGSAPAPEHSLTILALLAIVVAQANLTLLISAPPSFFLVRSAAIVLGIAAAGVWIWSDYHDQSSTAWQMAPAQRLSVALAICAGSASLALIVAGRFNRKTDPVQATVEFKEISIVCPHCGKKQSQPLGDSACGGCGLKFAIIVTEPRCPNCSYSLLMNKSERCPECGWPILAPPAALPGAG